MRTKMRYLSVNALRSEALFVSALQRSDDVDAAQIRKAIAKVMREYGGGQCAAGVAQEFGDHPELAVEPAGLSTRRSAPRGAIHRHEWLPRPSSLRAAAPREPSARGQHRGLRRPAIHMRRSDRRSGDVMERRIVELSLPTIW
jgi:hypothetical protein